MNRWLKKMFLLPVLRGSSAVLMFAIAYLGLLALALFAWHPMAGVACLCAAALPGVVLDEEEFQSKVLGGVDNLARQQKAFKQVSNQQGTELERLKRQMLKIGVGRAATPGQLSEECARYLGAIYLVAGMKRNLIRGDWVEGYVQDVLGVESKAALTASNIPLPTGYGAEVVALLPQYGAARRWGTVFPLGNGVVKLPRLKTSPAFGKIEQSAPATEVSPESEWVTFTAQKWGGLVRLPAEIDEDSVFGIGRFLGEYAAREMAKAEDHNYFMGTGADTGVNGAVKGLCFSTIDNSKTTGAAGSGGKTAYSDAGLTEFRALRGVPDSAALNRSAYYMHQSFEQKLCGFNSAGDMPYQANAAQGATLDGFPVRWVEAMPAYSTSANAGKVFALFGDLRYQYLGVRGGFNFAISEHAAFETDEVLVRALERFTIGLMATGAVAGLITPAN